MGDICTQLSQLHLLGSGKETEQILTDINTELDLIVMRTGKWKVALMAGEKVTFPYKLLTDSALRMIQLLEAGFMIWIFS